MPAARAVQQPVEHLKLALPAEHLAFPRENRWRRSAHLAEQHD